MKLFSSAAVLVLALVAISGCGGGPQDTVVQVQNTQIVDSLKKSLEEMAKTGNTGSALTALESDINGIKATDKAKGDALHEGFRKMQQATKPAEVKEIAKEMLSKL